MGQLFDKNVGYYQIWLIIYIDLYDHLKMYFKVCHLISSQLKNFDDKILV